MEIRPAVPEDAMAVAQVHVRSWQAAYRGLMPDAYLDALRPEDRSGRYDFTHVDPAKPYTQVAVADGQIVGFATTMPTRDETLAGYGELCALYIQPDHWRRGIGAQLSAAADERMLQLDLRDALLWVLAGNTRADSFYRAHGWQPDGACKREEMWGVRVEEQRYLRRLTAPEP